MERLEKLMNFIIKSLVDEKDKVNITYEIIDSEYSFSDTRVVKDNSEETVDCEITFRVEVAKGEMGKVIGKNGLTANAIRGVMQAAGVKDKLKVNVEFID